MTGQSYVLDPEMCKAYDRTYKSIQLASGPHGYAQAAV